MATTRARLFLAFELELDSKRGEAFWRAQRLDLSSECYVILETLARSPDKIHSPHELLIAANVSAEETDPAKPNANPLRAPVFR